MYWIDRQILSIILPLKIYLHLQTRDVKWNLKKNKKHGLLYYRFTPTPLPYPTSLFFMITSGRCLSKCFQLCREVYTSDGEEYPVTSFRVSFPANLVDNISATQLKPCFIHKSYFMSDNSMSTFALSLELQIGGSVCYWFNFVPLLYVTCSLNSSAFLTLDNRRSISEKLSQF